MKIVVIFSVVSLALILSACAPAVTQTNSMPMNNDNSGMTLAPGSSAGVNGTATPGSRMANNPEAAQLTKDTVSVAPGERYDIEFIATETGQWMLHCHILHHTTNDNVEPGGLMMVIEVIE